MYATSTEQRKQSGVQTLASELYDQHRTHLLGIARTNSATEADAEEALQEAFLSFITKFDPGRGAPPIAWLILTLKRACWCKARQQWRSANPGADGSQLEVSEFDLPPARGDSLPSERVEVNLDARDRMTALKPDERTALLLLGMGYSYTEIASARGWTYTKVNRCISEGRAAMRSAPQS